MTLPCVAAWGSSEDKTCAACKLVHVEHGDSIRTSVSDMRAAVTLGCQVCAVKIKAIIEVGFKSRGKPSPPEDKTFVSTIYSGEVGKLRLSYPAEGGGGVHWMNLELYHERTLDGPRTVCSHPWIPSTWSWQPREETYGPMIRSWLEDCDRDHPDCAAIVNSNSRLPSFLLDVGYDGPADQNSIRLHATCEGETSRYTALSHCWGGVVSVMTTKDTLEAHTSSGIPFSSLPATFRDAVLVTRAIGVKYLWIDCLCIIQDDNSHWEIESSKMASIYQRATLVIGANMSPNSHVGFVRSDPRHDKLLEPVSPVIGTIINDDGSISNLRCRPNVKHEEVPDPVFESSSDPKRTMPLLDRGWTLQEHMLATRFVHFDSFSMKWECRSRLAGDRWQRGASVSYKLKLESSKAMAWPCDFWTGMATMYCQRSLTRASDFLPALSGIATHMQNFGAGNYLAGIWQSTLPQGLLWMWWRDKLARAVPYRAPTWSWASLEYGYYATTNLGDLYSSAFKCRRPHPKVCCEVVAAHCEPLTKNNPNGAVAWGYVGLRGKLAQVLPATAGDPEYPTQIYKILKPEWDSPYGRLYSSFEYTFDLQPDHEDPPAASSLSAFVIHWNNRHISHMPAEDQTLKVEGLLVRKIEGPLPSVIQLPNSLSEAKVYERVGTWSAWIMYEYFPHEEQPPFPPLPTLDEFLFGEPTETIVII
ncbi:hypothetical protein PspLS_07044 [Pyricularia sp. CBS 133598]|nr:hypothetical protein PspLS_07044 [Pyricularia sp. CBS 133598]